jgi:hypothetical protein
MADAATKRRWLIPQLFLLWAQQEFLWRLEINASPWNNIGFLPAHDPWCNDLPVLDSTLFVAAWIMVLQIFKPQGGAKKTTLNSFLQVLLAHNHTFSLLHLVQKYTAIFLLRMDLRDQSFTKKHDRRSQIYSPQEGEKTRQKITNLFASGRGKNTVVRTNNWQRDQSRTLYHDWIFRT